MRHLICDLKLMAVLPEHVERGSHSGSQRRVVWLVRVIHKVRYGCDNLLCRGSLPRSEVFCGVDPALHASVVSSVSSRSSATWSNAPRYCDDGGSGTGSSTFPDFWIGPVNLGVSAVGSVSDVGELVIIAILKNSPLWFGNKQQKNWKNIVVITVDDLPRQLADGAARAPGILVAFSSLCWSVSPPFICF